VTFLTGKLSVEREQSLDEVYQRANWST